MHTHTYLYGMEVDGFFLSGVSSRKSGGRQRVGVVCEPERCIIQPTSTLFQSMPTVCLLESQCRQLLYLSCGRVQKWQTNALHLMTYTLTSQCLRGLPKTKQNFFFNYSFTYNLTRLVSFKVLPTAVDTPLPAHFLLLECILECIL